MALPPSHHVNCLNCKLTALCLPNGLLASEAEHLITIVKERRPLKADELLYLQGDCSQSLYAIKSGSFRSFITNANGAEQTVGFYLPGEVIGLDALQHGRFTCSAVALETAYVCELPTAPLSELCELIPALQRQLLRILSKEIASDHAQIILLGHRSAIERMATFLLMLSHRYTVLGFSSTAFNLTMSRHDIANFLGLTIETVSRQLALLTQQGAISVRQRGVEITNIDFLKTIVNACPTSGALGKSKSAD